MIVLVSKPISYGYNNNNKYINTYMRENNGSAVNNCEIKNGNGTR